MREGKRILIIDDDEFLSDLLCEQLAGLGGYQCVAALDGKAGLNAVAGAHFDLVLLDLDMPGMGGIEVCRQLRALEMMAPIIMFTADDSESATIEGLDHPKRTYDLTEGLIRRGYNDADIEGILGGNFKHVLSEIWSV